MAPIGAHIRMGSADQTRHRSLASLDQYIRMESAWTDNPATALDL